MRWVVSSSVVLLGALVSSLASAASRGPWLQDLGPNGVVVRVDLDAPAPAKLEIPGKKPVLDATATFHALPVKGLDPSTAYTYKLTAGSVSAQGSFTTAPDPDKKPTAPFTFVAFGDSRSDDAAHAAVVRAVAQAPSDFLVNTGDMVVDGSEAEGWQHFFDVETPLLETHCAFVAIGNHELFDPTAALFLRYFGEQNSSRLYRTMRWANTRFFFLNGMDTFLSSDERSWLDSELAKADTEPGIVWRVVVIHYGPWSAGPHGGNPRLQPVVDELFQHKIDLIVSGHDHIYERGEKDGMKYLLTGGGGAPLYRVATPVATTRFVEPTYHFVEVRVDDQQVKIVAKRADGSVMEKCGFAKGASWDCDAPKQTTASVKSGGEVPPTPPPTQTSKCGCEAVGRRGPAGAAAMAMAAMAAGALAFLRRRRRRR